jgi:hypothetical protein
MRQPINSSSWISEVLYKRCPDDSTYLAIFLKSGQALLYSGVPSHLPGLIQAGEGGKSVGSAYNSLVKGKYPYQRVEDDKAVKELRKMMILS